jgi:hypothetical protein
VRCLTWLCSYLYYPHDGYFDMSGFMRCNLIMCLMYIYMHTITLFFCTCYDKTSGVHDSRTHYTLTSSYRCIPTSGCWTQYRCIWLLDKKGIFRFCLFIWISRLNMWNVLLGSPLLKSFVINFKGSVLRKYTLLTMYWTGDDKSCLYRRK